MTQQEIDEQLRFRDYCRLMKSVIEAKAVWNSDDIFQIMVSDVEIVDGQVSHSISELERIAFDLRIPRKLRTKIEKFLILYRDEAAQEEQDKAFLRIFN